MLPYLMPEQHPAIYFLFVAVPTHEIDDHFSPSQMHKYLTTIQWVEFLKKSWGKSSERIH